jgi:glycosyltransferase involved in cell wall biosynthesis
VISPVYSGLVAYITYKNAKSGKFSAEYPPQHRFSLVIPFRNEAGHLPRLISSLNALDYPENFFEVIFIDDFSDDNSSEIIRKADKSFSLTLLSLKQTDGTGKKNALKKGITKAGFDNVITLDADVVLSKDYLQSFNSFLLEHPGAKWISGPVVIDKATRPLEYLQKAEFLALQALTGFGFLTGNAFLSNGANLYLKEQPFSR